MTDGSGSQKVMQVGPFPLRIAMAITFLPHRVPSLSDFGKVQGSVGNLGLPPEAAFVLATLEIGGSIAILLGKLTRISAGLFVILMASTHLL